MTLMTVLEGVIFMFLSFAGRKSWIGLALNPIYITSSLVGLVGCVTLHSGFLLMFIGGNILMNLALVGFAVAEFGMHDSHWGLYLYGPGAILDSLLVIPAIS